MIKTIIIDDEQHGIDYLLSIMRSYKNTFNVIATCQSVEEALVATKNLQPELVFLDIKIHDKTGFDYLEQLGNINFEVIFTTAFESYAIKAFKFSALDYLLKPIDTDEFNYTVKRLEEKLLQTNLSEQMKVLFHNLNGNDTQKKIAIPTLEGFQFLDIEDIIYCKADASYTHIFTNKNNKITVSKPLKHYDDLLSDSSFFRVHNSHLININHIKKYTKGKGGYVTMDDNTTINISTRRKEAFLKLLTI
jgi:two-component system, LytTR family, response regulator